MLEVIKNIFIVIGSFALIAFVFWIIIVIIVGILGGEW